MVMTRALAAIVLSSVAAGCGDIPFDVSQDIPEQTVAGSPLGGVLPDFLAAPVPLMFDLTAETEKRNTGPAKSATLKLLSFAATPHGAPSGNFDFLDEIHISIDSQNDASLPKLEIANLAPVPKGQTQIELTLVRGVDLLPYINKGAEISATASGTQPQRDFSYDGRVTITVHI
jgi:hypothetical protein